MSFVFYSKLEKSRRNVGHCPHVGGAAIGTLVNRANDNELYLRQLHGTIQAERERNSKLFEENQCLQKESERVKLELKLERQNKFATNRQKNEERPGAGTTGGTLTGKKRGVPVGHPGWFRKTPTEYNWDFDVAPPDCCPSCRGTVTVWEGFTDHLQEDVIAGQYRVVLYRHTAECCDDCGEWVVQPGKNELLGSWLGPFLRSMVLFLRISVGISYRKIPQVIQELFGITLSPAALIGFEKKLGERAEPIVDDIASSDGVVHADETYSMLDGQRAYFWVHGTTLYVHFTFGTTRSGKVSRNALGDLFTGTLVTDCYSGYVAHTAGAKQKCLVHLARTARDWQKLTDADSTDFAFFLAIKDFVKRGCDFHRLRKQGRLDATQLATEKSWLCDELERLKAWTVSVPKAKTLQGRISTYQKEWLVFVDDARVPPTNNLAEQALRSLVVLRKITFGHRTRTGGQRMALLMTVASTARHHGHRVTQIFFSLLIHPPNQALRQLYTAA